MSLKVVILKDNSHIQNADVVIDVRGEPEFYDVVVLGGRELKSLLAIGRIDAGLAVGYGKYTRRPVAAAVGPTIYIRAVPLSLYVATGSLTRELEEALAKVMPRENALVRRIKEMVIAERRKFRRSPSLTKLQMYVDGELDELPPHLADIVGEVDRKLLKQILDLLIHELY